MDISRGAFLKVSERFAAIDHHYTTIALYRMMNIGIEVSSDLVLLVVSGGNWYRSNPTVTVQLATNKCHFMFLIPQTLPRLRQCLELQKTVML